MSAPRRWARCNACWDEVLFDAWVTWMEEAVSVFDENFCPTCDGRVGASGYTLVDGEKPDDIYTPESPPK